MRVMCPWRHKGLGLVWMQPMNKELGPNFLWVADRYPTELPRSEPKGCLSHSSLTAA